MSPTTKENTTLGFLGFLGFSVFSFSVFLIFYFLIFSTFELSRSDHFDYSGKLVFCFLFFVFCFLFFVFCFLFFVFCCLCFVACLRNLLMYVCAAQRVSNESISLLTVGAGVRWPVAASSPPVALRQQKWSGVQWCACVYTKSTVSRLGVPPAWVRCAMHQMRICICMPHAPIFAIVWRSQRTPIAHSTNANSEVIQRWTISRNKKILIKSISLLIDLNFATGHCRAWCWWYTYAAMHNLQLVSAPATLSNTKLTE